MYRSVILLALTCHSTSAHPTYADAHELTKKENSLAELVNLENGK